MPVCRNPSTKRYLFIRRTLFLHSCLSFFLVLFLGSIAAAQTSPVPGDIPNLPPISLHLQDANQSLVQAKLAEALDIPPSSIGYFSPTIGASARIGLPEAMFLSPPIPPRSVSFSIDIDRQPFWGAIASLTQQQPIALIIKGRRIIDGSVLRNYHSDGPFIAQIDYVRLETGIFPQHDGELAIRNGQSRDGAHLSLILFLGVDPRLHLVRMSPGLASVVDDANSSLLELPFTSPTALDPNFSALHIVSLKIPAKSVKTFTLKGQAQFTIQLTESRLDIPNLEKISALTVPFAGATFDMAFDATGPSPVFTLAAGTPVNLPFDYPIQAAIIDSTGATIHASTSIKPVKNSFKLLDAKPPFKLTLTAPDKTKTIPFPYEFKDIPLP